MTKALQRTDQIEKGKAKVDAIAQDAVSTVQTDQARTAALESFGAITALWGMKRFISAQVVLALSRFQQEKGHEAYTRDGVPFKNIGDFLDHHPQSPMGKTEYYERLGRVKAEGADVYDLLSNHKVPTAARKLLAAGSIQIEGDKVTAGTHSADVTDREAILEMVKTLASENEAQSKKLDKGAADLDKQKKKYEALKKNPGSVDLALKQGPGEALMTLLGFYATFREQVELLSDADREKLRNPAMGLISNQHEMLAHTLGVANTKKRPAKAKADALAQLNAEFGTNITEAALDALDDED